MSRLKNKMQSRTSASSRTRTTRKKTPSALEKTLVSDLSMLDPLIELATLRLDGDTQPRQNMDPGTVETYSEAMIFDEEASAVVDHSGTKWPEIVVFHDGDEVWLADGFHRVHAALASGIERFQAEIKRGTVRDAVRYSLGVNGAHGLRRTKKDKRRVVERALTDAQWQILTDTAIARMCVVSKGFVSRTRRELERKGSIPGFHQLFREDGEPVDRTPDPLDAPEAPSPTPTKARRARRAPADAARAASAVDWDGLDALDLDALDALVAYPQTQAHWERLATLCAELDGRPITLVTPHYRGSVWSYRGPMALDALVDDQRLGVPQHVRLSSGQRAFWVWSSRPALLDESVERASDLLAGTSRHAVVGTSIDVWTA